MQASVTRAIAYARGLAIAKFSSPRIVRMYLLNCEIAYRIYEENDKTVVVILAGTRENFYKKA